MGVAEREIKRVIKSILPEPAGLLVHKLLGNSPAVAVHVESVLRRDCEQICVLGSRIGESELPRITHAVASQIPAAIVFHPLE